MSVDCKLQTTESSVVAAMRQITHPAISSARCPRLYIVEEPAKLCERSLIGVNGSVKLTYAR